MDLITEFLFDRDRRVSYQEDLLKKNKNKTLVTIRINYPGIEKSNYITDDIVNIIYKDILIYYGKFIVFKHKYKNKEGVVAHFLFDLDFVDVKKEMINVEEEHILGRCLDIDVYTLKNDKIIGISRSDLYKKSRKCFICDLDAKICSRAQTHTIEDIKEYFEVVYKRYKEMEKKTDFLSYRVSQLALKAMISEVSTFPSFGLVSPVSSGSHKDMDYYTFLNSSMAITPYLKEMFRLGYSHYPPEYIFHTIRNVGKECEEEMFKATNNINTHKGMIFLMGICMAAIGKALYHNEEFSQIQEIIKDMVKNIFNDFKNLDIKKTLTHGERLYLEHGFTGIRGQVRDGLSIIFEHIIDKYKDSKLKKNDLYTQILIELMSKVEDSTIVYRHDMNTLRKVQSDAKELLKIGGILTEEGKKKCYALEDLYINENISPGGCADLLAVSILLMDVKKCYYKLKKVSS